jgi:hypothetical protein
VPEDATSSGQLAVPVREDCSTDNQLAAPAQVRRSTLAQLVATVPTWYPPFRPASSPKKPSVEGLESLTLPTTKSVILHKHWLIVVFIALLQLLRQ